MDLSPPAAPGGQSHFRDGKAHSRGYVPHAAKIGTVPVNGYSKSLTMTVTWFCMRSTLVDQRLFGTETRENDAQQNSGENGIK